MNLQTHKVPVFPRFDRRIFWIGLGLLTLIFRWLFRFNPNFVEIVYSRGLFVLFRLIWDYTLGWLPFPWLYLAVAGIIWALIRFIRKRRKKPVRRSLRHRIGSTFITLAAIAGAAIFFFYTLWGYNYQRVPLEVQLNIEPKIELDSMELVTEARLSTDLLIEAHTQLDSNKTAAVSKEMLPGLESEVREELETILAALNYPTSGRARCRRISPPGMLLQLGASGIYIPYIGEGQIDGALAPVSRPFTYAHEMAHAYGFGDEGTANFIAFLTCEQAPNPLLRYAGRLAYWRHVINQFHTINPEHARKLIDSLPPGISADLAAIRQVYQRYPGFFPQLSRSIYDAFLRQQGVEEGIRSYSRVVSLVMAWREKNANL